MDIQQSIVSIVAKSSSTYQYAGTGFFVEGGYILTCAHVVNGAQVTDGRLQFRIEGQKQFHEAEVVSNASTADLDISVLKPVNLTLEVPALALMASRQSGGHPFTAFGYPQQGNFDGLHADGVILGWVRDRSDRDALQLSSNELTHGYSGCPIWDEGLGGVVGMVSSGFDFGLDKKLGDTVFAIPSEVLKIACPELKLGEISQPQIVDAWNLKHPYPMPPNFTGRIAERATLIHWLKEDSENHLFILRALGGFGKSALAWQWLTHDVASKQWSKVLWWSFYEGDASFEHFVEETLKYLKLDIPQGKRERVDELLRAMQSQKVLLIMDGFERALRAYSGMNAAYQGDEEPKLEDNQLDCVDVNAELFLKSICSLPNIQSKVLMTTRLTPRAVRPRGEFMLGCREVELTAMQPADAVEFFHKQKIKGNRGEIESACEPYGYHPLSLRLLAGRILKDFDNPADIVVAQRLKIDGDIIQQKHHVLEVSYNSLPPQEQKLLSTIACFRSPVELKTLDAINVGARHVVPLHDQLHDLVERGLLHFDDKNKKFDLHPIVRRYAYDHLTASDRTAAHARLVNYFEAVPKLETVKILEDLAPVIELYHHMVGAENLDEACDLFYDRLHNTLYYQFGAYQLVIELERALFLDGEDNPPRLKEISSQAWALTVLANAYALSGQPRRAVPLFEMQIAVREKQGVKKSVAIGLGNLANRNIDLGALNAAERNLRRQIDLCREIDEVYVEGVGHAELGRMLIYTGLFNEAEKEFPKSIELFGKVNAIQYIGVVWSYRALRFLLLARTNPKSQIENLKLSIESAKRAIELADEWQKITGRSNPNPRDYTRALWLLGAAYRANNELTLAEENLSKALNLCRQINSVEAEADILLDLARLRYASQKSTGNTQGDFKDAQEKASEALMITERSGYVLQGADVHLLLASLALEGFRLEGLKVESNKDVAIHHAKEALRLATCDGPPYYYKVAYEEAVAMLERLKV